MKIKAEDMSYDKMSRLEHELEMDRLRKKIHQLEKEKVAHMKGIERLKKSNEKLQNQVKNLQITNEESYKREEKLEDKVHKLERVVSEEKKRFSRLDNEFLIPLARVLYSREAKICKPYSEVLTDIKLLNKETYDLKEDCKMLSEKLKKANDENNLLNCKLDEFGVYYRTDEKFINNIQKVIFPQEEGFDYAYSYDEILNKVKEIKVQSDENGTIYEDLGYWKERCHKAETDVTTLNSKVEVLKNKSDKYLNKIINQQTTHYKQCSRILELENMVNKLQSGEYDDILTKDIEIKSLQAKYEDAMAGWKDSMDTNDKQIEEFTRRYNMIAKKLNDIHDILKEESDNE